MSKADVFWAGWCIGCAVGVAISACLAMVFLGGGPRQHPTTDIRAIRCIPPTSGQHRRAS